MVVLVIGMPSDVVIKHFAEELRERMPEKPLLFINQQEIGGNIHFDNEAWHVHGMPPVRHEEVTGVWNRLLSDSIGSDSSDERRDMHILIRYFMNEHYPKVLNKPIAGMTNFSKPYQLSLLSPRYIRKPNEFVTNDLRMLKGDSEHKFVEKSVSSVRSIVKLSRCRDKIGLEPIVIQEYLAGVNIRVHVVGEKYVATKIIADKIDYRYATMRAMKRVYLPKKIATDCIDITKSLGLSFSGIDLIYCKNRYWLLEVNTAPGYSFFRSNTKEVVGLLLQYWQCLRE